jgi:transposase
MEIDVAALPDDPQLLREVLSQALEALSKVEAEKLAIEEKYLALFNRLFRPRSEKLNEDQLSFMFESLADMGVPQDQLEKLEEKVASEKKPRQKRADGSGRKPLPPDLPRERVEHPLPESERCCGSCGSELTKISEDKSEQLEYIPASLKVIEHVRGVYACKCCEESIRRAPKPPQAIEKGIPGPGLLAHVIVSKYGDHLPLYRQQVIFERYGIEISRSTQCSWVAAASELAVPLVCSMRHDTLSSEIIKTDDTTVTVLGDNRGSYKGRLWVYIGDRGHPHQIFVYSPDREGRWPRDFLKDYRGYLQSDAYSGYDEVHKTGVLEVACWAHMRRYFFEALNIAKDKRALVPLGFIKLLFKIEVDAKDLDAAARQAMRQERAKPLLGQLEKWIEEIKPRALPKSRLGQALTYATNQWIALNRYLEHGDLCIDNNASERALRTVAVGRKNWMFAGSDEGGRRAAIFYTLIASAKANGVEPFAYLRSLFELLPTWPTGRLHELWPVAWKARYQPG